MNHQKPSGNFDWLETIVFSFFVLPLLFVSNNWKTILVVVVGLSILFFLVSCDNTSTCLQTGAGLAEYCGSK